LQLELWVDGGMRGKNPGALLYGSYQFNNHEKITKDYGVKGTNNEAEYLSLIEGLNAIIQEYGNVQDIDIVVRTDSQLVENQVHGYWKVSAEHLRWLCYIAQTLLCNFHTWEIRWVPRKIIVEVLGH